MTEKKRLILNLFEMNTPSHITHGLWRLAGNNRERFNDLEYWTELAQLLEHGGFDGVFLADVIGAYDTFRGGIETALREGVQIPSNDPLLVVPAMAAVTRRLGFGVTFSTTYEPPFSFARRISTLDHLTKGRIGWNIVTSYLPNAAKNFGFDEEVPHDQRYEVANEYIHVLYKLWEGSWDDDAVLRDRERGIYTDPAKVRYIDHVGAHYSVKGPHLSEPSRQRTPVLFQATGSPAGIAFAGHHSEVVFTGGSSAEDFRRNAQAMRDSAVARGRGADDIKFIAQAGVFVGRTQEEAEEKFRQYRLNTSLDGILTHMSSPIDLTKLPRETLLLDVPGSERFRANPTDTVGDALDRILVGREGRFFVVGTPRVVADEIERWMDEGGVDGINLRQYHSFRTAQDFIELVVPELRKRGRLGDEGAAPSTLRNALFGRGDRLPDTHVGARYRGGAHLQSPIPELGV